jgi:RimJ/RimL family protein N-acetyltransferase
MRLYDAADGLLRESGMVLTSSRHVSLSVRATGGGSRLGAIQTARLTGRQLADDDRAFVKRVWNDERVCPTIGGPRSDDQLRERIDHWTRHWADHGFGVTLFSAREHGRPVGWGGLQRSTIGIGERLTVGYVVTPEMWGAGYASEIAAASAAYAFEVLAAAELYASVLSTNDASRRVLEKAGLRVDRDVAHGDHVEVIYVASRTARR